MRGKHVEVNADADLAMSPSTGSLLTVEVLDAGRALLAKSHPLQSDGVKLRPRWQKRADLAEWIGQPIQLRFTLRFAKLYAFQIVNTVRGKRKATN